MAEITESERAPFSGNGEVADLSVWLEQQCQAKGLSCRQMAAETGVSHATIAAIKNGARPSAATIVKLADGLCKEGQHQRQALKDRLLSLGGYRDELVEDDLSEPLSRLMDRLTGFSNAQLKIMGRFADFISTMETNNGA